MRLTSLEIKGFKSFGEKTVIHFDKGVTAIVGPNGSGKSNVVDAMRWVLGEQKTRMLRSEKMENIIFNGTKTRKQASVAEVSISFDNTKNILPTEYTSVTITRRLYRSGESEYLLNNVTCRLKDITDLFMDTGIGSDSYAIIELKMVDEILNDKNNSIKLLFEEAAGISKYKVRKKQTLNKLEETDADLSRVNDLLFEIEKNLKTLESQARKTERYYKLKEQYKELSTELALFTISSNKTTYEELQSQETNQIEERIALEAQIAETEARLQADKLVNLDLEKELGDAQKQLNEKISHIRQQENDKKISNEKLKYLQDKEAQLSQQLSADKNNLVQTQDQISLLEEEKFAEENLLTQLQQQLEDLRGVLDAAKLNHDSLKSEVNLVSHEVKAIQLSMHESEKSYAVAQARKESLHKEIDRLKNDTELKSTEHEPLAVKTTEAKAEKELKETELQSLVESEEQMAESIIYMDDELKRLTDELMAEGRKLDAKENEYKLTKSLVDNLEGYPESLRYIKKSASKASQAPLFSDVLSAGNEFKSALEIYLEPYMNYFVIEDIEEASKAVNLLSEASKGRANFFILKNFEDENTTTPGPIAGCIHAMDILEVEEKYRPLCSYLLRNVYIVTENQDNTPSLQNENRSSVFISQNGKYCRTKHALSGGSVGLFDGKRIGRAKHMEQLSKEIEELSVSLSKVKALRDNMQRDLSETKLRKEKMVSGKNRLQQELNKINHEFSSLSSKAEHLFAAMENNKTILNDLESQLSALEGSLNQNSLSHQEHLDQMKATFNTLNERLTLLQSQFNDATHELDKQSNEYNQHHIKCIQQQNKLATTVRDLTYKVTLLETLQKNITSNTTDYEGVQVQIAELISTSEDFDTQLIALYADKEAFEQTVNVLETNYFKARGAIDELETAIRQIRHRKEQSDQLAQAVKDKTMELKMQLNGLKERLSVEFGLDINELLDKDPSPDWTEETLREKVTKQKSQLDNYGPINPMAVEAFNEIKERHTFIIEQKDDLARAKESLLQTISEIEMTAKENFMKAFVEIRTNFMKVFRSLFTEDDDCDLILLDPSNPTESDVQIIAKPKGKRPLSISQLSGGEKTLTAIALLFGIYLIKPAPFCIFDEVDAPLDDTNIDKFNNIIKKFSGDSQFIIITHNKRTMTSTDIIYGITMAEPGVTQVVPVDLTEVVEN
ncbi:MAG: chromosome segregation protein SMC [Bacteroidetes bacterium]|nr:chromosome segregation protein SMC [Bacteroidota bacterium]